MKKLFLIPLLTLVCSVMAWGADAHVSSIADLNTALADASVETIYLDADLTYAGEACINILRSVTIDGQGHKIIGDGVRTGSTYSSLAINQGAPSNSNWIDSVALKNLTIRNTRGSGQALNVRCNLSALLIENCEIVAAGTSGNTQPITFGGSQSTPVRFYVYDSKIEASKAGYPVITFNPIALKTKNSTYTGYCALYFKGVNSSAGSGGSSVDADACDFNAPNMNEPADGWNSFGVFAIADGGITFNLNNCGFNSKEIGSDEQQVFLFKNEGTIASIDPCVVHITGDNSHINGHMLRDAQQSARAYFQENYDPNAWNHVIEISGGTYAENPSLVTSGDLAITIAEGYEVNEVAYQDAETTATLYRVVKKAQEKEAGVMYDLNDFVPVEGEGYGDNPVSSFDLSTGTGMTLNNEVTTAGYVQVSDNEGTGVATTVTVGQTAGGKDQTLVINNGLDVQGKSQVIVESGATLKIGEGGINTEDPENIVIEANENGAASLLLDPTITVNQTPNLTVRMTAKQIGRKDGDFYWHRFAMPVAGINSWGKEGSLAPSSTYPTYLYAWDYNNNEWANIAPSAMEPLQGYTLTLASNWINADGTDADAETDDGLNELQDVVYTFKGNLVGNENKPLDFKAEGFNFFGNSYTGYMDVKTVLEGLEDENIDKTAYMWNADEQIYVGVSLTKLNRGRGLEDWQKEVAPMQTFILRLRGADDADGEEINYASAIWGNPNRYGNNNNSGSGAPSRVVDDETYMEISVKAANGKGSSVDFTESASNSDAFESGYDVEKYMNKNRVNLYATVEGVNLSSVVTDNIEGKILSLQTNGELAYTMSFKNVEGEAYAIRDNVTGKVIAIEEGTTYEFAAQPNSTIEGRFEIVPASKVATAIENTEVKANVKGIYTITGQYLGENFDILPAGVYVVDGVKIVK